MAVDKIDPTLIFASNAPAQDTPAVFNNKDVGWGESRKNGGKPTIKQMNAMQQDTDLKILWLNENSVTPYDASISYPTNAVTIKDGEFKIFNGTTWSLFLSKSSFGLSNVDNTSDLNKPISTATQTALNNKTHNSLLNRDVANAHQSLAITHNNGETQKQINDYIGTTWYARIGGYNLYDLAKLDSGELVFSTINANTNNPNTNMTGWMKAFGNDLEVPDLPNGKKLRVIAGAIRNTGSGWAWINDNAHEPYGVTPTITTSGVGININYGYTASQVVLLQVTPDETLARLGLTVGASVGVSSASIEPKAPVRFTVNTETGDIVAPAYFNTVISATVSGGVCTVTHPSVVGDGDAPLVTPIGTVNPKHTDVNVSYSTTESRLVGAGDCDGQIAYNGTSWAYTGELQTAPTMSWVTSGSNDAWLEVNHAQSDVFNISLTSRTTLRPTVATINGTGTQFKVRFYDSSGAIVLSPNTNMSFFFSRKARLNKTALRGTFSVSRGYSAILPENLVSEYGNFWVYGLMEV